MNTKALAQWLGVAGLLAFAAYLFLRSPSDRPRIDFDPYRALGEVAGEEVLTALSGQGRIALVLPAPGPDPDPVMEAQVAAFESVLKARGGVSVAARVPVAMDPFQRMSTGGAMPADQFEALRRQHPDVDGYVLFIGFPALDADQRGALRGRRPKIMVISAPLPGYETLLREGILEFAMVPRPISVEAPPAAGGGVREVFDREYLILRGGESEAP
jgi:hypothetical protein